MSDLISREEAIHEMEEACVTFFWEANEHSLEVYQYTKTMLQALPSAEKTGKWTPCTERLPNMREEVWVTIDDATYIATLKERKTTFGNCIQEWWTDDGWICQFEEVIAWQPLNKPEPYNCGVKMIKE